MEILEVDCSPLIDEIDAEIGSIATATDGSGVFYKFGILSTNWKKLSFEI